ncbi:hypothetical protein GR183_12540 [Stappia sp. GBMRC 2046]|uniref:Uncharacterized protein n=1 Tax=Stappia sediminis TaxID=2692190 RepID=A0A7X3LV71_9HYPH|nr:hypothetical protein [Stappia sediminis]
MAGHVLAGLSDEERHALYLRLIQRLLPGLHGELEHRPLNGELLIRHQVLLQRAHDAERRRGIAGHWTFDANRLIGLAQAVEIAGKLASRL